MYISEPIFDDDSVRTELLFITKSLSEILNIVKTQNIKLCAKSIPTKIYEDLIKTDNIAVFSILYESLDDKSMLENIMIDNEMIPSYSQMKGANKIFDLIAPDMITFHTSKTPRWTDNSNILHMACWMAKCDTIIKIIKSNPELLIDLNINNVSPIGYFLVTLINKKNIVENEYMNVVKSIDKKTYQIILNHKMTNSWTKCIGVVEKKIIFPVGSTIIDMIKIIMSNDAIDNKIDFRNICNGIYDQLFSNNNTVTL